MAGLVVTKEHDKVLSILLMIIITVILKPTEEATLRVRFDEKGISPSSKSLLADNYPETCSTFAIEDSVAIPQHTQVRVQVPDDVYDYVNATLIGTNLGCGNNLYVSPLSPFDTEKWTGRWATCQLLETSFVLDKERCLYQCKCSGNCEEIQILKMPKTREESSWSLCHICLIYNITGCSHAQPNCSGVYHVKITTVGDVTSYANVYCDMVTDGGGWTVVLRRQDGSINFTKEWQDFKDGFGSLNGEFYLGNEMIHKLTLGEDQNYSLVVDLEAYDGQNGFGFYTDFSIGPESDNYKLHISGYLLNSTVGDSLTYHDGMMFSTIRRDNDKLVNTNCAVKYKPWWHKYCCHSSLFAKYGKYPILSEKGGMNWEYDWGKKNFAKRATMMIRPN